MQNLASERELNKCTQYRWVIYSMKKCIKKIVEILQVKSGQSVTHVSGMDRTKMVAMGGLEPPTSAL